VHDTLIEHGVEHHLPLSLFLFSFFPFFFLFLFFLFPFPFFFFSFPYFFPFFFPFSFLLPSPISLFLLVHDTVIEHGVKRHLPYAVCMENGGVQCVIEHGVERHLPHVVSPAICYVYEKWRGKVCDRAWCGASPAICCVSKKWRV